ncbi:hypothetical protein WR25_26169 isoform A [Diploscapter pachys]|uniref:WH1 domain-containing protein n=1 Tax=Diploscapter pachys TaxID=2018661 RepID=A0A2A2J5U1_9BILA|nr:hypothetical protein WR25_26169 isoform A [Diploscapter pachys]
MSLLSVSSPCYSIHDALRLASKDPLFFYVDNKDAKQNDVHTKKPSTNNNNEGNKQIGPDNMRPSNSISALLETDEINAIKDYLNANTIILTSGISQLLREEHGQWAVVHSGLIGLVKDYNRQCYELQLLVPTTSSAAQSETVKVLWRSKIPDEFNCARPHSNLMTFEIEGDVYGLNFYKADEARDFVGKIFEIRKTKEKRLSRIGSTPKRPAPPAPTVQHKDPSSPVSSMPTDAGGVIHDSVALPQKKDSKTGGFFHNLKSKLGDRSGKKEKKQKKKKITAADISKPSNFQHVDHLGINSLDDEGKELYDVLKAKLNVTEGNVAEESVLVDAVMNRRHELRNSIMVKKERDQNGGLKVSTAMDTDHEYLIAKRGTPRDIKNADAAAKKGEPTSERAATPAPSTFGKSDPLRPDWDSPSVSPPLSSSSPPTRRSPPPASPPAPKPALQVHDDSDLHHSDAEQAPPPLPTRGESRHPGGIVRKNTPSGFDMKMRDRDNYPRLPAHHHKAERAASPPPVSHQITPPMTPGSSPIPPPPPAPPPDIFTKPQTLSPTSISSAASLSPPTTHNANKSLPSVSDGRKSLLTDIQNVDKSRLLKPVDNASRLSDNSVKSPQDGGILQSLQAELEKIRAVMESDSEEDEEESETDEEWN